MRELRALLLLAALFVCAALALPFVAGAAGTTLVNDTFADANSQNQDLANNSMRVFNGRSTTVRTDAAGSVTFDLTNVGSNSEAFWSFFTNAGSPVTLGVGEKLTVSETFVLGAPFPATVGSDVRFGLLDSKGTRNTANLTGGMNQATFADDTGYGMQFFPSGTGSPFTIGRRKEAGLSGANNPFNSMADFPALAGIPGAGAGSRLTL